MNDEVKEISTYKLVACRNCRVVSVTFVDDMRKRKTLDCRVCGKKMEYMMLKGMSDDVGNIVFEGENIEKDVMSQFL